jgi:hypothetical protein
MHKFAFMGSGQDDFSIQIQLDGETRQVACSPYNFGTGKQLKCSMTWENEPIEFWLHFKTGVWKFKNSGQIPKEILKNEPLFNRTLRQQ